MCNHNLKNSRDSNLVVFPFYLNLQELQHWTFSINTLCAKEDTYVFLRGNVLDSKLPCSLFWTLLGFGSMSANNKLSLKNLLQQVQLYGIIIIIMIIIYFSNHTSVGIYIISYFFTFTDEDALNILIYSTISDYICWLFLGREFLEKMVCTLKIMLHYPSQRLCQFILPHQQCIIKQSISQTYDFLWLLRQVIILVICANLSDTFLKTLLRNTLAVSNFSLAFLTKRKKV